jgi:hypothetical protein
VARGAVRGAADGDFAPASVELRRRAGGRAVLLLMEPSGAVVCSRRILERGRERGTQGEERESVCVCVCEREREREREREPERERRMRATTRGRRGEGNNKRKEEGAS